MRYYTRLRYKTLNENQYTPTIWPHDKLYYMADDGLDKIVYFLKNEFIPICKEHNLIPTVNGRRNKGEQGFYNTPAGQAYYKKYYKEGDNEVQKLLSELGIRKFKLRNNSSAIDRKGWGYWKNDDNIINAAKDFTVWADFENANKGAANAIRSYDSPTRDHNNWIKWVEEYLPQFHDDFVEDPNRKGVIYYYIFPETHAVYVGWTLQYRIKKRNWEHEREEDKDTVARYIKEHNISLPEMHIAKGYDDIPATRYNVYKAENDVINYFRTKTDYEVINKAEGGSLGGNVNNQLSLEKAIEYIKKYNIHSWAELNKFKPINKENFNGRGVYDFLINYVDKPEIKELLGERTKINIVPKGTFKDPEKVFNYIINNHKDFLTLDDLQEIKKHFNSTGVKREELSKYAMIAIWYNIIRFCKEHNLNLSSEESLKEYPEILKFGNALDKLQLTLEDKIFIRKNIYESE